MRTLTLTIPDDLDFDDMQLALLLAGKLYEQGKLSSGQAADLAGLTRRTFLEMMGINGVSIFNYPASDLSGDVANA